MCEDSCGRKASEYHVFRFFPCQRLPSKSPPMTVASHWARPPTGHAPPNSRPSTRTPDPRRTDVPKEGDGRRNRAAQLSPQSAALCEGDGAAVHNGGDGSDATSTAIASHPQAAEPCDPEQARSTASCLRQVAEPSACAWTPPPPRSCAWRTSTHPSGGGVGTPTCGSPRPRRPS